MLLPGLVLRNLTPEVPFHLLDETPVVGRGEWRVIGTARAHRLLRAIARRREKRQGKQPQVHCGS